MSSQDILISVRPKYVEKILFGQKTIELRNRAVNIDVGTRVWIYSTLPTGKIVAVANVNLVVRRAPSTIWRRFGKETGLSRQEFFQYVEKQPEVSAIRLCHVRKLDPSVPLERIRSFDRSFHPPQFFMRLFEKRRLLKVLHAYCPDAV